MGAEVERGKQMSMLLVATFLVAFSLVPGIAAELDEVFLMLTGGKVAGVAKMAPGVAPPFSPGEGDQVLMVSNPPLVFRKLSPERIQELVNGGAILLHRGANAEERSALAAELSRKTAWRLVPRGVEVVRMSVKMGRPVNGP